MALFISLINKGSEFRWQILTTLGGIFCGLFFLRLTGYGTTLGVLCVVGVLISFLALVVDVKRVFFAILLLSLPVNLDITIGHTGHLGGAAGFIISLYDIALTILYLLWLTQLVCEKDKKIRFFPEISLPFILLIIMGISSIINAYHPDLCMFEIIEMVKMYFAFLYIANNIKNKRDIQFVATFLLLGLFLESVLGLAQYKTEEPLLPPILGSREKINYFASLSRVSGTWASYNDFAWYITFILPIAMALLFSDIDPIYKFMCALTVAAGTGTLICTLSRAGWISIAVSTLQVLLLTLRTIKGKTGLYKFSTVLIMLLMLNLILCAVNPRFLGMVNRRIFSYDYGSAESRKPQMEVAYNIIKAHPFLGIGINNYTKVMHNYDTTEYGLTSITPYQVHNIFLQIAAETGVLGLMIFIWLIAAIYRQGLRCIRFNNGFIANVVIGILGGITAFLIHGLFDAASIGNRLFLIFWTMAGIIASTDNFHSYKACYRTLDLLKS